MKKTVLILCVLFAFTQVALAERISIKSSTVNIRSGPGTKYKKVALIENATYYPLDVIKKKGNWYHVKDYKNYTGWIYTTLVSKKDTVITEIDDCSIRKGPGLNYQILMVANNNVCLKEISRQGKWIKIEDSDGDRGWIHRSLVW